MVDMDSRALKLQAHAADIQDGQGAGPLMGASRCREPFVQVAFAYARYQAPRVAVLINRNRRLAKNVEATIASAKTVLYAASLSCYDTDSPVD